MNRLSVLVALVAGGYAASIHAACDQPPLVVIPTELEGIENEVVADTEEYFQAMQEYVNCIRVELESIGDGASELYTQILVQRNNLAVAEAEAVQRWFNSRIPAAAD